MNKELNTKKSHNPISFLIGKSRKTKLLVFVSLFAIMGTILILRSYAATTVATVEGESLTGSGTVVAARYQSNKKALKLTDTLPASTTITTSELATQLVVHASGNPCQGVPQLGVTIDDQLIYTANITAKNNNWGDYTGLVNVPRGTHKLAAYLTNPYTGPHGCIRAVKVDTLVFLNDQPPPTPSDQEPPTVSITKPANNSTVTESTDITIDAHDNVGVSKVQLYINDTLTSTMTASPYVYNWDTTNVPNGNYVIKAVATDTATNNASATTTVTLKQVVYRDIFQWPLSRYSIWNMPIGSGAQYAPAGIAAPTKTSSKGVYTRKDNEFIGLDTSAPLKTLTAGTNTYQARVPANLQNNGAKNGCTSLLTVSDPLKIYQGQWLVLTPGGNPSWEFDKSIVKLSNANGDEKGGLVSLNGAGMWGCHGGSALSGFAGAIHKGELNSSQPIRHALEYEIYCYLYCSRTSVNAGKPFRWPAYRADDYANDIGVHPNGYKVDGVTPRWYNGTNPQLTMGSLLALKPDFNVNQFTSPHVRKIAQALKDYGAYIVDDSTSDYSQWAVEYGAEFGDGGNFEAEMRQLSTYFQVVTNNSPTSVGGGGVPRVCYAPPFANNIADLITVNPNGSVLQPKGCS